jgi:hypothetical protein
MNERILRRPLRPQLRDIRADLQERLREALSKRDEFLAKAKEYDADVDMLQRLIDREDQRHKTPASQAAQQQRPDEPLPDFVLNAIRIRPQSKGALRQAVANAGYDVDGRSIHATTVNLLRRGKIKERDGVFSVSDLETARAH